MSVPPVRLPTLPVPVGNGPASSVPPPEGVNIAGELAGKFLRLVPMLRAGGRLDVGDAL